MKLPNLIILRPGALKEREEKPRLIERIAGWIPFLPVVTVTEVARCMVEYAYSALKGEPDMEPLTLENCKNSFR